MGTRNVTIVKLDGEIKLAKYCQWDGYPSGQGVDLFNFVANDMDLRTLKKNVRLCEVISEEKAEDLFNTYLKAVEGAGYDKRRAIQALLVPSLTRDTGGGLLLKFIQKQGGLPMTAIQGDLDYATGKGEMSFGCEYCYEIDLDNKTVKVYDGHYKTDNLVMSKSFRSIKALKSVDKTMEQLESKINEQYN